jgi:hypothetical protein
MTRRSMVGMMLAFGLAAFVFGVEARPAAKADATGTWTWSFQRQNGESVDITLKLMQVGDKLTGTITGPGGRETEIKDGKVSGDDISFTVVRERNGNTFTTKYQGKQTGDTLKGKVEFEATGETRSRDWEAKRTSS